MLPRVRMYDYICTYVQKKSKQTRLYEFAFNKYLILLSALALRYIISDYQKSGILEVRRLPPSSSPRSRDVENIHTSTSAG